MPATRDNLTQGVWSKLLLLFVTLPPPSGSAFAQNRSCQVSTRKKKRNT